MAENPSLTNAPLRANQSQRTVIIPATSGDSSGNWSSGRPLGTRCPRGLPTRRAFTAGRSPGYGSVLVPQRLHLDFRTVIQTPIPVLFAQGDWDTQTPVENTLKIIKSFPNGRVIIAERGGHGVLEPLSRQSPKVWADMMDFLRTGTLPNLPERVTLPGPKFVVPNFPAPAPK